MASATLGRFFAFLLALSKSVQFRRRLSGYVATQGKAHSLAACLLAFTAVLALFHGPVNAEPKYFILSGFGASWPRYPSAADACEDYRKYIQAGNDSVSPGGTTVLTAVSTADTGYEIRSPGLCTVVWSRGASSFSYKWNYYSGGCAPGRQPKPNGNRNASTKTTNGQTTSRSYTVKRDYEKGKRDRDVWADGRPKRKF